MRDDEIKNKLTKHWWVACGNPITDEIDLNEIDGSYDFTCIPQNSKGEIKMQVGELRSIVDNVWKVAREEQNKAIVAVRDALKVAHYNGVSDQKGAYKHAIRVIEEELLCGNQSKTK